MPPEQQEDQCECSQETETARKPWVKPEMQELDAPEMTEVTYSGIGSDFQTYSSTA